MTAPSAAPNQAEELLQAADRAFAAGELRKGYRLVWEAAMAAVKLAAKRRDVRIETEEDAWKFVQALDGIDENGHYEEYPYLFGGLSVSESFLEQAMGIYDDDPEFCWEGDQYEFYLLAVKHMVASLTDLANGEADS